MSIMRDIQEFKNYLITQGAEILPVTSGYELLRFQGSSVGVIYTSGKTNSPYASEAINCYRKGIKWTGRPYPKVVRKSYKKERERAIDRDGTNCFYCGIEMGEDITVEHLIPLSHGGPNVLSNIVLAHSKCNNEVGSMGLIDKVNFAIEQRVKNKKGQI